MLFATRLLSFAAWLGFTVWNGTGAAADFADDFADREMLTGESELVLGSNFGATRESGEPWHADKPGGHSVWISWTAPANGLVTLSTEGSTFDTLLAVYSLVPGDEPPLKRLHELAASDDEALSEFAVVQFGALAGEQYDIAVDGFAGATGDLQLQLDLAILTNLLPAIVRRPADQALREGGTLILTTDIDRQTADDYELRWYFNGLRLANAGRPTLVITNFQGTNVGLYRVRLEVGGVRLFSEPVEIQINSEGETNVLARNKLEDASLSGLASGNGAGAGAGFAPRAAASAGGGVNRGYNGSQVFNTSQATRDPLEPQHCGVAGGPTYWFSYQPPADGILHLDTEGSSYDTLLAVYTYDPPLLGYESLIAVACDDNGGANGRASRVEFETFTDRSYFIVVDGVNGERGIARLNYQLLPSQSPLAEPVVLRQPVSWTAGVSNTIALEVIATGAPPLSFQWYGNDIALPDQTNTVLTLVALQPSAAGAYHVAISNALGSAISEVAVVEVLSAPAIQVDPEGGVARLAFPAVSGFQYRIEMSHQVPPITWSLLASALTDGGGVIRLTNTLGPAPSRFYRLRGP